MANDRVDFSKWRQALQYDVFNKFRNIGDAEFIHDTETATFVMLAEGMVYLGAHATNWITELYCI